jgi:SAM-dependent methyltransferase
VTQSETPPSGFAFREAVLKLGRAVLPRGVRREISRLGNWPPRGAVRFGSLRRVTPISKDWGLERGLPIDRYYIDRFLSERADLMRGTVLEIGEKRYTRLGGDRVQRFEVLHVAEQKPDVTRIGDLSDPTVFPSDTFDCIVVTQTLQLIYEVRTAIESCHRFLRPGGTLLVTIPGISQISRYDMDRWGHYWSFTTRSAERLFGDVFGRGPVEVVAYGNVLSSISFLHGLASEELTRSELDAHDPDYQLLIGVAATKAPAGA